MALVFDHADEYLLATGLSDTDWTDGNGGGTVCFWAKKTTGGGTGDSYGTPLALSASTARSAEFAVLQNGSTNWAYESNAGGAQTLTAWTNDVWIFFAFGTDANAVTPTDRIRYGTGAGLSTPAAEVVPPNSNARITLGQTCNLDEAFTQFEGKVAHVRVFNELLSEAEMLAEAQSATVVKTSSCIYAWPLISNTTATTGAVNFVVYKNNSVDSATFDSDTPVAASTSVAPLAMGAYSRMRNG